MGLSLFKQEKFILLVFLAIVYYSAYEILSLNENEQLIQEVYNDQLNLMLYSVNKSAWDICNDWMTKLGPLISKNASV